jgi:predicted double-glycine peptidase
MAPFTPHEGIAMRATAILFTGLLAFGAGCASGAPLRIASFAPSEAAGHVQAIALTPVSQQIHGTCGAAALATVLNYWGTEATVSSVLADTPAPEREALSTTGLSAAELRHAAQSRDLEAVVFAGRLADVYQQIDRGRPLIVLLPTGQGAVGHWCVAVGYDPAAGHIIFADPARGLRTAPATEFERAWTAAGRVAVLAAPAGESSVALIGGGGSGGIMPPRFAAECPGDPLTAGERRALQARWTPDLDARRGGESVDFESVSFWTGMGIGGGVMLVILIIVVAV